MPRRLSAEERALWRKVVASIRPLEGMADFPEVAEEPAPMRPAGSVVPARPHPPPPRPKGPGTTLDAGWDRRLSRGLVAPDRIVDLHGRSLAGAHALVDQALGEAVAAGARLLLLITGRPPRSEDRPVLRGAIRAAIGDWLAASRFAGDIAAIRTAHRRHGGAGALYVVLRRRRAS